MLYFIERWVSPGRWERVSAGIHSKDVADNMKRALATKHGESEDNFSILVEC